MKDIVLEKILITMNWNDVILENHVDANIRRDIYMNIWNEIPDVWRVAVGQSLYYYSYV